MDWIMNNWFIVVGIVAVLVSAGLIAYKFLGLPTQEQVRKIKKLLLYWVTEAEAVYGSQTGVLKLRYVYDLFTAKFPLVAKLISFDTFSFWVDEALDEMKELLKTNEAVKNIVDGITVIN